MQYRNKQAPDRILFDQVRVLAALCARRGNPLFVNGRLDLALLAGAHLHLPVDAPRPSEARPRLPPGRWITAAVHDLSEAKRASGADFALVSPVFRPTSKPDDPRPTLGVAGARALASRFGGRCYALGGITPETAAQLPVSMGMAVQGAILGSPDPRGLAERIFAVRASRPNRVC